MEYAEVVIGGTGEAATWKHSQSWAPHWCHPKRGPHTTYSVTFYHLTQMHRS